MPTMQMETVGNLHSVALIDLLHLEPARELSWEPSFCSLDRLKHPQEACKGLLGTFIL